MKLLTFLTNFYNKWLFLKKSQYLLNMATLVVTDNIVSDKISKH